mgnify:CR=1 FL=1
MKILFISMPSIHAKRWIENLIDTDHEIFWFDILDKGNMNINLIPLENQFVNWKNRKKNFVKGEYKLSKYFPFFYRKVETYFQTTASEYLEYIIKRIEPDVIQSFEMQSCSYPILKTMKKFENIKWIYSCWGSDLYYYSYFYLHYKIIKKVLKRIDFIFTDCKRDLNYAIKLGFNGESLGVLPGGSGYNISDFKSYKEPLHKRKIILIKGYEHKFGRATNVLRSLELVQNEISNLNIIVFGSHQKVIDYIKCNNLNYVHYKRHELSHPELIELMGKSLIYIGNSISDGIPNTLLEALMMGAFPIQSNPGGATEEYINNKKNGLLINDPYNLVEISSLIKLAVQKKVLLEKAFFLNKNIADQRLERKKVKNKIIESYRLIDSKIP